MISNKIILFIFIFFLNIQNNLHADIPHFVDFRYILNESDAGRKAQTYLKNKLNNGIKKVKEKEKSIQEEEKKIISQKKIISADEYKKKVQELRKKVSSLQKQRAGLLETISKQRAKAKTELLKNLNPILTNYMKERKIRMVVDKKSLLIADENLDITKPVLAILNNKLKSIKLD
jgi:outer membrane protein